MHERDNFSEIPKSISQEGEEEFFLLFGIPFHAAQELATWEGEIGDRYRNIFKYLKEGYEQSNNSGFDRNIENSGDGGDSTGHS